jgi:hypothetical protein
LFDLFFDFSTRETYFSPIVRAMHCTVKSASGCHCGAISVARYF